MREILFRGKRLDNGEWVNGSLLVYPDGNSCFCYICSSDDHPFYMEKYQVDPATVGQYTGLTDKNGKKIFEGDIVRHYNRSTDKTTYEVGLTVFNEKMARFKKKNLGGAEYCVSRDCVYQVIGNRWDNPELLEGQA